MTLFYFRTLFLMGLTLEPPITVIGTSTHIFSDFGIRFWSLVAKSSKLHAEKSIQNYR